MGALTLSPRLRGVFYVAAASFCWSSGGIFVRLIGPGVDGWTIVFWRSVFMAATIGLFLFLRYGRETMRAIAAVGRAGFFSGCLLTGTFIAYILAMTKTTVASASVLMSVSPLVAAMLGWPFLGEKPHPKVLLSIAAALAGISLMFGGHMTGTGGNATNGDAIIGDLLAIGTATAFAANIILVRRNRHLDMAPANLIAGVISALVVLPLASPLSVPWPEFVFLPLLGFYQLGMGLFFFVRGAPYLSAAEVGLLCLLETVLAPVWVWLFLNETPSATTLLGGGLVILAVAAQSLSGARNAADKAPS